MGHHEIKVLKLSDHDEAQALEVLTGRTRRKGLGRLWPFLGPAFIASVAYVDPGNFATTIESGTKFGYTLVWVVLASNIMAMFIQALSAKLGLAAGKNLADLCRLNYPKPLVWAMWAIMELVAFATDLAEFLGAALGFYLLFGMPLWIAGLLTALVTFLILALDRFGIRPMEFVISGMVGVVALCYLIEVILAGPDWGQVFGQTLRPGFQGQESVTLAVGILGATVMPHVIYLHSALTQGRIVTQDPWLLRRLFGYELLDVILAMTIAGAINAAMLIMAAKVFHERGLIGVDAIEKAYITLEPLLGPLARIAFGVSLLAAGLSSSAVGTMAGQIIMQGFVNFHIPVWLRRTLTMFPALLVIWLGLNPTRTLILSQVFLSFGLPAAVIPLIHFTSKKDIMGVLVNRLPTMILGALAAAFIVVLNGYLLWGFLGGQ